MVGSGERQLVEIDIAPPSGKVRLPNGVMRNASPPPYIPESIRKPFHPSGNSVCYTIQLAHLMGCDPIYLLGFTLQTGSAYFFGRDHPVYTGKVGGFYDQEVPLEWCRWYEAQYPGRVRLWPGWSGPIYGVFQTLDESEADAASVSGRDEPDPGSGDVHGEQRPG